MDTETIEITTTRESGSGRNYLRFSASKFNEFGVETSRKNAFKEIKKGADIAKALEWAKGQKWRFGSLNRQSGQYEIVLDGVEASELEHA